MELATDVRPLARNITVTVRLKGVREMRFRLWLAGKIMRFGAWVGNVSYRQEIDE